MTIPPPLEFRFPLPRPHCGVALGNGAFGALVWGAEDLRITVSRNDHWDHRNGVVYPEGIGYRDLIAQNDPANPAILKAAIQRHITAPPFPTGMLPGGRFDLRLVPGMRPWLGRLHFEDARLEVILHAGDGTEKSLWLQVSPTQDRLYVDDPAGCVEAVQAHPAWEWVGGARPAGEGAWKSLTGRGFGAPRSFDGEAGVGWFQAVPADPGFYATAMRLDGGRLLCVLLAAEREAGATAAATIRRGFEATGAAAAREQCGEWWRRYWAGVPTLTIPEEFFQRFYHYAQYKFACAANPHARLPATLQGPWYEEYQMPPWQGNYTVNVNIQQIYSLAFTSGNLGFMLPLFDMLDAPECRRVMRQNAARLVGVEDGLMLTHSVNDQGCQCQGGLRPHAALDQAVAGWLAQLYWLYYRHGLDESFLRERAWPFMTGAMRVYEAMLEERDGHLSLPLGASPEFGSYHHQPEAGRDASWQLACVHMLVEALLAAAEVLRIPPKPCWHDIRRRLPLYTLVPVPPPHYQLPGDHGRRIGLWEGQDLPESYRHHAHLAAIYPFDSLGELTPEQQEIVDQTLDAWVGKGIGQWSEWCVPWAVIIQARTGFTESPLILLRLWRELFVNEGLATVYIPQIGGISDHRRADQKRPKETCEIMQLDGTMAAATALIEMLIHTRAGTVHIFPAVSPHWPDADFEDVCVPGAFRVSGRRRAGRTVRVEIASPKGGRIRVQVADQPAMRVVQDGSASRSVGFPVEFDLPAGTTIRLEADRGPGGQPPG